MQVMAGRKRVESASQEPSFACFGFSTSCPIVADPYPLTPLELYRFRNSGRGVSASFGPVSKSLRYSRFAAPIP